MPTSPLVDLFRVFLSIGLMSFGGPAAQIALMHRVLVDERRWLSEDQYLRALSFCMLLPGPEAMQLATYAGWLRAGITGGLIAGGLFVLPGAVVVLALAMAYAAWGDVPVMAALFLGIKAAVLAIVAEALIRVARRALKRPAHYVIAALSFVAIFVFGVPFPLIVLGAGLIGATMPHGDPARITPVATDWRTTVAIIAIGLVLWWLPVGLAVIAGWDLLAQIGLFFSKLAVVTFGGAYAVLAYMAQEVVDRFGWLAPGQMTDALGLAETTPGPLILVTEFVGYLAGHAQGGAAMGVAAAAMTLWVTFVPCFLWIFAAAPYLARITAEPRLAGALSAITAAVVGVILNLSLWMALHVLFGTVTRRDFGPAGMWLPDPATLDWRAAVVAGMAGVALLQLHWRLPVVLAASAAAALVLSLA